MKIDTNQTQFLNNATDVKHKDILTIASEGKWIQSTKFFKEDKDGNKIPSNEFRINLKLSSGEERNTTFGWNNVKMLVEAFGDETTIWIGKEVKAWKTKSEKAKLGYTFIFAPISWERDETGEWIKNFEAENQDTKQTTSQEVDTVQLDEPQEENINPEDIPF